MTVAAPPRQGFSLSDFAVIAVMNLMWGLNIIAVKMAVMQIAPLTAGFMRQTIVLLVCATWLRIIPGRMIALTTLGILSGGIFYCVTNLSLAVSDNVGALAIAGQLGVPFSIILAIIVFRERIRLPRMAGIALSFAGVVLLVFDPAAAREGIGLALTALASFIWAVSSLVQRKLIGVPVLTIYAWIGFWGTIVMGGLAWLVEPASVRALPALPLGAVGWVAFSAIGSTVIGQGSMSYLLQRHPISMVMPMTLAAPIISVFAAAYYFATPLAVLMLLGGAVAMLGVAIVTIRTARAGTIVGDPK